MKRLESDIGFDMEKFIYKGRNGRFDTNRSMSKDISIIDTN
jgi:hypothetical protein